MSVPIPLVKRLFTTLIVKTHREMLVDLSEPVDVHLGLVLGVVVPRLFRDLIEQERQTETKKR